MPTRYLIQLQYWSPGDLVSLVSVSWLAKTHSTVSCGALDHSETLDRQTGEQFILTLCDEINKSPRRKAHNFLDGQWVYVRNRIRSKFDPLCYEVSWVIESVAKNGVVVNNAELTKRKIRHVDDIKPYKVKTFMVPHTLFYHNITFRCWQHPRATLCRSRPQRSIAADRPERQCKRKEDYTTFLKLKVWGVLL